MQRLLCALVCLLTAAGAQAETAVWSIAPQYDSLEPMGYGLYKVKRGSLYGIVTQDGRAVTRVEYDSISDFTEGRALLLSRPQEQGCRLYGLVSEDGRKIQVSGYPWVDSYPFFSEGLMPVKNEEGLYGYINTDGEEALKFEYGDVHPFSDGFAVVMRQPKGLFQKMLSKATKLLKSQVKMYYVDRFGQELKLPKLVGDICMGTTFSHGFAIVENHKGRFFKISSKGEVITQYGTPPTFALNYMYQAGFTDGTPEEEASGASPEGTLNKMVTVYEIQGKYGYRRPDGSAVLPAQFSMAEPFYGEYAAARISNGRWGLLRLSAGTVDCRLVEEQPARAAKGKKTPAKAKTPPVYLLTIPEVLKDAKLTAVIEKGTRSETIAVPENGALSRRIEAKDIFTQPMVTLYAPDLMLWRRDSVSTPVALKAEAPTRLKIAVGPGRVKADVNDRAVVTVTVSNPTPESVTTTVNIGGKNVGAVSQQVTIPSGGKKSFSVSLTKIVATEVRTVNVTAGGVGASKAITAVPFFVKL